eukprot:287657-Pleurochrysis_carterae.AAC.1
MGGNSLYPPSAYTAVNACRWPICRPVGLEPSGPYERKSVVPTEAEPSRIDAPTSGGVNI